MPANYAKTLPTVNVCCGFICAQRRTAVVFSKWPLVHFAVSQMEARMTTKLEGPSTTFLPFNRGNNGGAGNPPSP
jgi:type I restriction enzyme R subunit